MHRNEQDQRMQDEHNRAPGGLPTGFRTGDSLVPDLSGPPTHDSDAPPAQPAEG